MMLASHSTPTNGGQLPEREKTVAELVEVYTAQPVKPKPLRIIPLKTRMQNDPVEETLRLKPQRGAKKSVIAEGFEKSVAGLEYVAMIEENSDITFSKEVAMIEEEPNAVTISEEVVKIEDPSEMSLCRSDSFSDFYRHPKKKFRYHVEGVDDVGAVYSSRPFGKYYVEFDGQGYPSMPESYTTLSRFETLTHFLQKEGVSPEFLRHIGSEGVAPLQALIDLITQQAIDVIYHPGVDRFIEVYVHKDFIEAAKAEHELLKDKRSKQVEEPSKSKKTKKNKKSEANAAEIPHIFEYWRIMDPEEHESFARELHDQNYPGYHERRGLTLKGLKEENKKLLKRRMAHDKALISDAIPAMEKLFDQVVHKVRNEAKLMGQREKEAEEKKLREERAALTKKKSKKGGSLLKKRTRRNFLRKKTSLNFSP